MRFILTILEFWNSATIVLYEKQMFRFCSDLDNRFGKSIGYVSWFEKQPKRTNRTTRRHKQGWLSDTKVVC